MDKNIYISYRRTVSEGYTERIFECLQANFGIDHVFLDVTSIGISDDYVDAVNWILDQCQVVIVLIGPHWLSATDEMGEKRLDDPHDFVRMELQAALERDVLIVPVLVGGAKMPNSGDLPYDLRDLADYQPINIRQRRFAMDMTNLVVKLIHYFEENLESESILLSSKPKSVYLNRFLIFFISIFGVIIITFVWYVGNPKYTIGPAQPSMQSRVTDAGSGINGNISEEFNEAKNLALVSPTETVNDIPSATVSTRTTDALTVTASLNTQPTQTITSLQSKIVDPIGVEMVLVPQGPFIMGTDGQEFWQKVSQPAHLVGLDMFYIDKFEVSNAQYARCVKAGNCRGPIKSRTKTRSSYYDNSLFANYPVVYVSWEDAQTFCSWRRGRLPSEAEWEKAARGNKQLKYPWGEGEVDCEHANFWPDEACEGDTSPVDSLPSGASPYDVWNMSGNVQEWVSDWFQVYPGGDPNATKEFGMTYRVTRGGAYIDGENFIQAISRKGLKPEGAYSYVGFRCVIDIEALP